MAKSSLRRFRRKYLVTNPDFPFDRPTDRTSASILASVRRCWRLRSQAGWPTSGWIIFSPLDLYRLTGDPFEVRSVVQGICTSGTLCYND